MQSFLAALFKNADPEQLKKLFLSSQLFIGAILLGGIWFLTRKKSESSFKMREADIRKPGLPPNQALGYSDPLSAATMKKRAAPLSLSGIRIDGAPHEVLGISTSATEQQVQAAYRELMKQYHPDKIGRPGTREWTDAQKIAEALNHARAQMIAHLQSQSPKRSGR